MITAAVLAGGSGSRMGAGVPKQFLEIGSKPIIVHSISRFTDCPEIDGIIVAVSEAYTEYTEKLVSEFFPEERRVKVITGGSERGATLLRVLEELERGGLSEDDIVLTHDAVRPFIDRRIICENIAAAKKYGACNTCIPAVDTVFLSADGSFIDSVPPRTAVYHAQTPQSFRAAELLELCRGIPADVFNTLTDGCSVYTYFGKRVYMVRGSAENIKITYPADIKKAEIFLKGE